MQNQSQKSQVSEFIGLTGTSKQIAQKFLTKSRWNFQQAINKFYDQGAPMPQLQKLSSLSQIETFFSNNSVLEDDKIRILNQQGLQKLFSEMLKLDMANPVIGHLMINVMKMQKAGVATKQQLYNLFNYSQCKSFNQLRDKMYTLQKQLKDRKDLFKNMYLGLFDFYSTSKTPTLDFDIAVQIWQVYLKNVMPFHQHFINYLNQLQKKPYKIFRDVWKMAYEFANEFKSVQTYSESQGWPLLLDDFVNYLRNKGIK